jgi:hypothetical protein
LQDEILAANPASKVRVIGVNQTGQEAWNAVAVEGNLAPWLQDADNAVWGSWEAAWRDVVVLDTENRKVAVFNLFEHDLSNRDDYAALRALLLAAAGE